MILKAEFTDPSGANAAIETTRAAAVQALGTTAKPVHAVTTSIPQSDGTFKYEVAVEWVA